MPKALKPLEDVDASKIKDFEDILGVIGSTGWRSIMLFVMASATGFMNPMLLFTYSFLGATPDHWCLVDVLQNTSWTTDQVKNISIPLEIRDEETVYSSCTMYDLDYSMLSTLPYNEAQKYVKSLTNKSIVSCSKREFDDIPESIVTKWDLVCERRVLYSTTQSSIHFGLLLGGALSGYALDKFGRLPVFRASVIIHILCSALLSLSPTIGIFIAGKVICAITSISFYMAGFVLAVEFTSTKQRSLVATYFVIPWAFGIMGAAAISYLVRPWYYLQLALTMPNVLQIFAIFLLSESPRWLITQGRHTEALRILNVFAKSNGTEFPDNEQTREILKNIQYSTATNKTSTPIWKKVIQFFQMYITLILKFPKRTAMLFFCWFTSSMVYYSISLGSTALSSSDYLYIFLGGAVELVSYVGLWPAVVFLGRRKSLITYYLVCSVSIGLAMILVIFVAKSEMAGLKMALFLFGKFAITANFHLLWVYTAELYPTTHRSLAVGQGSTVSRLGSMCSSYLNDILGAVASWAPSSVFASMSLIACILALMLPETGNECLPDTFETKSKQNDSKS